MTTRLAFRVALGLFIAAPVALLGCEKGTEFTRVTCRLDGGAAVPCTSPVTYPDLPAGPHWVEVCATTHRKINDDPNEWASSDAGCDSWAWTVVLPGEG